MATLIPLLAMRRSYFIDSYIYTHTHIYIYIHLWLARMIPWERQRAFDAGIPCREMQITSNDLNANCPIGSYGLEAIEYCPHAFAWRSRPPRRPKRQYGAGYYPKNPPSPSKLGTAIPDLPWGLVSLVSAVRLEMRLLTMAQVLYPALHFGQRGHKL